MRRNTCRSLSVCLTTVICNLAPRCCCCLSVKYEFPQSLLIGNSELILTSLDEPFTPKEKQGLQWLSRNERCMDEATFCTSLIAVLGTWFLFLCLEPSRVRQNFWLPTSKIFKQQLPTKKTYDLRKISIDNKCTNIHLFVISFALQLMKETLIFHSKIILIVFFSFVEEST